MKHRVYVNVPLCKCITFLKAYCAVRCFILHMCCAYCCQGPFATFKMQQDKDCDWTGLKFSPDGKLILISTNGHVIRLIDAFQGTPLQTFMVNAEFILLMESSGFDSVVLAIEGVKLDVSDVYISWGVGKDSFVTYSLVEKIQ